MRVKDQRAKWCIKWTARSGDSRDECLENFGDADPRLRRREDDLFSWNREGVFEFAHHRIGVGGGEVNLVQHRNDHQAELHRQVHIGERLRLDPLARIHNEDGAVAGLQAS